MDNPLKPRQVPTNSEEGVDPDTRPETYGEVVRRVAGTAWNDYARPHMAASLKAAAPASQMVESIPPVEHIPLDVVREGSAEHEIQRHNDFYASPPQSGLASKIPPANRADMARRIMTKGNDFTGDLDHYTVALANLDGDAPAEPVRNALFAEMASHAKTPEQLERLDSYLRYGLTIKAREADGSVVTRHIDPPNPDSELVQLWRRQLDHKLRSAQPNDKGE